MDGVFMRKIMRNLGFCLLITAFVWGYTLIRDRQQLNDGLIRLHVVANSDSASDQALKLQVRDAVLCSLERSMQDVQDIQQARQYLRDKLPQIRDAAETALRLAGCQDAVEVSLCREAFAARSYESFSLPAGVYQALRIVIGDGQGKNWWCVVYPGLCQNAASAGVEEAAQTAGFSHSLTQSLTRDGRILRFALLDALGWLENILFDG